MTCVCFTGAQSLIKAYKRCCRHSTMEQDISTGVFFSPGHIIRTLMQTEELNQFVPYAMNYLVELYRGLLNRFDCFDGELPLVQAVRYRHDDLVAMLLRNGALADQADASGDSAISIACKRHNLHLVWKLLREADTIRPALLIDVIKCRSTHFLGLTYERALKNRADDFLNDASLFDGDLPLIAAVRSGHLELVTFFLEKGATPDIQNDSCASAISVATELRETGILRELFRFGGDLSLEPNKRYRGTVWRSWLECMEVESKESSLNGLKNSSIFERNVLSIIKSMVIVGKDWQPEPSASEQIEDFVRSNFGFPYRRRHVPFSFWNHLILPYWYYDHDDISFVSIDPVFFRSQECDICSNTLYPKRVRVKGESKYFRRMDRSKTRMSGFTRRQTSNFASHVYISPCRIG
eukprot:TRINITY_DN11227_c0_g1_i9.p1 TRINITY_DN11227_c0_g1~~TRINITY_DN11227_c0_g1_i9.p1  ORF type:complete len:409 (-),score=63.14 TRINITY_DN11227_c0_g1_i9:133-1359(-)